LVRITAYNRGPQSAPLHILPQIWFRNYWSWGRTLENPSTPPSLKATGPGSILAEHPTLGRMVFDIEPLGGRSPQRPVALFTETNPTGDPPHATATPSPSVKAASHKYVILDEKGPVTPANPGTKAAAHFVLDAPARSSVALRVRLTAESERSASP